MNGRKLCVRFTGALNAMLLCAIASISPNESVEVPDRIERRGHGT